MPELPRLNRALLGESENLPEKIVQFGSGRFVRGFIEYFIDRANREGLFGGRVVVVQSTGSGRSSKLAAQDGLYTLVVQGLENGRPIQTRTVLSSISRALSADDDWEAVLKCTQNPDIVCVISNTTEVGIILDETDRPDMNPPRSFPGKLTTFLFERAKAFSYAPEAGLVVLPCELIEQNGDVLRGIVLDLARRWGLGEAFGTWVSGHCLFCNALVDRIVTGTPAEPALRQNWEELGYVDDMLTVAEVYRLWAVQGDDDLKRRLPFLDADPGIVVAADITPYRDLKVRILNGTHTVMVPLSLLAGNETVLQSMQDPLVSAFIRGVMLEEIVPSLDLPEAQAAAFAHDVLDRFANPFLEHLLINITFQSTTKMRHRIVPSLLGYFRKEGSLPQRILLGFAAYLLFMRGVAEVDGTVYGERGGERYPVNDDRAPFFQHLWRDVDPAEERQVRVLVQDVCGDASLWGTDLSDLPGLVDQVTTYIVQLAMDGARQALLPVVGEGEI